MKIPVYLISAFSSKIFSGNPAAVCPLKHWIDDDLMQAIAKENNVSETAFFIQSGDIYHIRWFSPLVEIDLCGHATLATAHVLFKHIGVSGDQIIFCSKSGNLSVIQKGELLAMDFPSHPPKEGNIPQDLLDGLGLAPLEVLCSEDYLVVFKQERDLLDIKPDMDKLKKIDLRGVIVTARGSEADFGSRFFAPKLGIPEDPVTGSAHCTLIPYWSKKLAKQKLLAHQLSKQGGELFCQDCGERVIISGRAVTCFEGNIYINPL